MKNDMRVTLPLWQMGAIVLMMIVTVAINFATKTATFTDDGFEFEVSVQGSVGVVLGIAIIIFTIYLAFFLARIAKHNKRFPDRKISTFTFKPQEYIEDDELFEEITKRATKKVYTYYTWTLPLLVGASLGGFWSRTTILFGILLLAMGQYWIYYRTMRKFLAQEEEEE